MAKEVIAHRLFDWSRINENESFWGRIDLLGNNNCFDLHRYNGELWTSGQVGIGRVYDKNNLPVQDNGKEHVLIVTSSYGLDPWKMLESVMFDDEYDDYLIELEQTGKFLFHIFYEQPPIKTTRTEVSDAVLLPVLSFVNSCYSLCRKGLKKTLIYHENNFTAKLRGRIDVNKNIKHNTTKCRADKFYCKYIDFTEDSIENRILKAAVIKCRSILNRKFHNDTTILNKTNYCLHSFKHVKTTIINNSDYSTAVTGGLYSYYKPVIQQAKAILNNDFYGFYEDPNNNTTKDIYVVPFVVNMETLFEYYARTVLKQILDTGKYKVGKYSHKLFLQKDTEDLKRAEKGIHLMSFCIPDIIIYNNETPIAVIDAKYKPQGRPDRSDTHQLLSYVLLTGVSRCGFIMPDQVTSARHMKTSDSDYLPLVPDKLQYYELYLGNDNNKNCLKKILE